MFVYITRLADFKFLHIWAMRETRQSKSLWLELSHHVNSNTCHESRFVYRLCLFILRLENEILDIQAAIFILILGLSTPQATFNERTNERAKQNYEENININMCEHEQNFHALDVVFYSFLLFSYAIGRSYLVFCLFSCCFYVPFPV